METTTRKGFNRLLFLLATWFGCGSAPRAPGTFGTLGAIPLAWLLVQLGEIPYLLVTLVVSVGGVLLAQMYEDVTGSHDAPEFVLDEVAGFLITMALVPFTWPHILAGFILFRLLDILKPFPISWVDKKVPGGVGAMGDDILAGLLANVLLQVALHYGVFDWSFLNGG